MLHYSLNRKTRKITSTTLKIRDTGATKNLMQKKKKIEKKTQELTLFHSDQNNLNCEMESLNLTHALITFS